MRSDELKEIRAQSSSFGELDVFTEGCTRPGLNSSHIAELLGNGTGRKQEDEFFFIPEGYVL